MKKAFFTFFIAAMMFILIALTLAACSKDTVVINVYNWGEYMSVGKLSEDMDVNKEFEEYYAKKFNKNVKVNYITFDSNEDLYAKLKSGATGYDVIVPSDYMLERLAYEGMLAELDFNNIPSFATNIDDAFKNLDYDPDNKYSVPYAYGVIGIIYDKNKINMDDYENPWDVLWDEKYKDQVLMVNNSRDAFGVAMNKLNIDVNTENIDEWKAALTELKTQKTKVNPVYVMDEIYDKMESGSASVAVYYAGDYLTMKENAKEGLELGFYQPERTNFYVDAFCVPKESKNKDVAEAYIEFMLQKEAGIANALVTQYASPNKVVYEDDGYAETMGEEAMTILYSNGAGQVDPEAAAERFADSYNSYSYRDLKPELLSNIGELWDELKISSGDDGIELWKIIVPISIVVILIIIIAAVVIGKKKRKNAY